MAEFTIPDAEHLLAASLDHRVLKRVPPVIGWPLAKADGPTRKACFIDIKATGPSIDHDQIMALGSCTFVYDVKSGFIVEAKDPWLFEEPEAEALEAMADGVDLFITHQATFVRPLVEKISPVFLETNWACSHDEIGWADEGLWSARVNDHLMRLGWFNDQSDLREHALSGAFLMTRTLPRSGRTVLDVLLAHARRPLMAVRAVSAPVKRRELLKRRGYHWDTGTLSGEAA